MSSAAHLPKSQIRIGDLARRAGVTVATLRFYEERALIFSARTSGNMRIYPLHTLRRVAMIAAGQRVGLTLTQIGEALADLPRDRAPSQRHWEELSSKWKELVDQRIEQLHSLRDSLDGCIGCGCLSTTKCSLFNPQDEAAAEGPGSRWIRNFDADFGPHET